MTFERDDGTGDGVQGAARRAIDARWTRVLLVGFMGAGKSTVGAELARRLGWTFYDFDSVIEAEEGRSVAAIFEEEGEGAFRRIETQTGARLLREKRVVLGAGGGWAAVLGRLGELPEGTASVWLKVSPEEAVRRTRRDAGRRPLLDLGDPLAKARALLEERGPGYAAAGWRVDTDRSSVEDVTARILDLLSANTPATRTE